jgi:hypothetical protein
MSLVGLDALLREELGERAERVIRLARKHVGDVRWTLEWMTTAPNPRAALRDQTADAGQRGWSTHAVFVDPSASTLGDVRATRAACGLLPSHGWGIDLFIERRCRRCVAAILKRGIAPASAVRW